MLFPHIGSKRITLHPATAADAVRAYHVLFELGRAGLPLLDDYVRTFGARLTACFLVRPAGTDEVVGLGTLGKRSLAGHLRAEVAMLPGQPDGALGDANLLLINYAFAMWRLRKVYLHTVEPALDGLGLGPEHASLVVPETVLPQYAYLHGVLRDVRVLAVDRARWDAEGTGFIERIVG